MKLKRRTIGARGPRQIKAKQKLLRFPDMVGTGASKTPFDESQSLLQLSNKMCDS